MENELYLYKEDFWSSCKILPRMHLDSLKEIQGDIQNEIELTRFFNNLKYIKYFQ